MADTRKTTNPEPKAAQASKPAPKPAPKAAPKSAVPEGLQNIPLAELHPFKDHPFQVIENEELQELARSIAQNGVLTPGIARPRPEGGYELISGHRRKMACELAGLNIMPVFVRDLDDDSATIVMVDSNQQRENLLPSEKAFSYKMKLEAMKRKAGRPSKKNSAQVEQDFGGKYSVEILASESEDSRATIQRFIRLTYLIPDLMKMVDEKHIAMSPAVELSYLPRGIQKKIYDHCQMQQSTPSLSQAVKLKNLSQKKELTEKALYEILSEPKANQKDRISFRADTFAGFFPKGTSVEKMQEIILDMLKQRKRQQDRLRDEAR